MLQSPGQQSMQVIGIKSSINQKATPLVETNLNRWIMLRRWLPWLAQLFHFHFYKLHRFALANPLRPPYYRNVSIGLWSRTHRATFTKDDFLRSERNARVFPKARVVETFPVESSQLPLVRILGTPAKDKKQVIYEEGTACFPTLTRSERTSIGSTSISGRRNVKAIAAEEACDLIASGLS
jgi:hypothetical protein